MQINKHSLFSFLDQKTWVSGHNKPEFSGLKNVDFGFGQTHVGNPNTRVLAYLGCPGIQAVN